MCTPCCICLEHESAHGPPRRYCQCEAGQMHPECLQQWISTFFNSFVATRVDQRISPDLPFARILIEGDPPIAVLHLEHTHTFEQARYFLAKRMDWLKPNAKDSLFTKTIPRSFYMFPSNTDNLSLPFLCCTACRVPFQVDIQQSDWQKKLEQNTTTKRCLTAFWRCFGHFLIALVAFFGLEVIARCISQSEAGGFLHQELSLFVATVMCISFGQAVMFVRNTDTTVTLSEHLYDWRDVQTPCWEIYICKKQWQQRLLNFIFPRDSFLFPELSLIKAFRRSFVQNIFVQNSQLDRDLKINDETSFLVQMNSLVEEFGFQLKLNWPAAVAICWILIVDETIFTTLCIKVVLLVHSFLALLQFLQYILYMAIYKLDIKKSGRPFSVPSEYKNNRKVIVMER